MPEKLDWDIFSFVFMKTIRATLFLGFSLLLGSCIGNTPDDIANLPFPITSPSDQELQDQYQMLDFDLSPLPAYRFRIQIPNGWKTLDVKITEEPEKDQPADVAVFRQPGPWMTDETVPINGEISVNVVNVAGNKQSPADWLQGILRKNAKGYTIVHRRLTPSSSGEIPDMLISYLSGGETIISRMMAFRSGDRMFIITGSDTKENYANTAEAFNVAISTFRLVNPES